MWHRGMRSKIPSPPKKVWQFVNGPVVKRCDLNNVHQSRDYQNVVCFLARKDVRTLPNSDLHSSEVAESSTSYAGVKAGMPPLPGGRQHCVISYGMWVPVVVRQLRELLYTYLLTHLLFTFCIIYFSNDFCQINYVTRSSAVAEGQRDASCQLKSCQLPRNSAETTYTTSPDQIDGTKLEI